MCSNEIRPCPSLLAEERAARVEVVVRRREAPKINVPVHVTPGRGVRRDCRALLRERSCWSAWFTAGRRRVRVCVVDAVVSPNQTDASNDGFIVIQFVGAEPVQATTTESGNVYESFCDARILHVLVVQPTVIFHFWLVIDSIKQACKRFLLSYCVDAL